MRRLCTQKKKTKPYIGRKRHIHDIKSPKCPETFGRFIDRYDGQTKTWSMT